MDAIVMFIGSGPGRFECKARPNDPEPDSWDYNRLVQGEYSLGGRIGWQLASCMAEAYRACGHNLPQEIDQLFPRFMTGPRNNPALTDAAVRASHRFFPAWHTNAVKCHEGPAFTSEATGKAVSNCVQSHLLTEICSVKPQYLVTLGLKAAPAISLLTGIDPPELGCAVTVSISSVNAGWSLWWHNPQFNAHKDDLIITLAAMFGGL